MDQLSAGKAKVFWRFAAGAVSRLLWERWDPIGVNSNQNISDEYDEYAHRLMRMLTVGCNEQQMFDYLRRVEKESIGVGGDERVTREVAALALAIRHEFDLRRDEIESYIQDPKRHPFPRATWLPSDS